MKNLLHHSYFNNKRHTPPSLDFGSTCLIKQLPSCRFWKSTDLKGILLDSGVWREFKKTWKRGQGGSSPRKKGETSGAFGRRWTYWCLQWEQCHVPRMQNAHVPRMQNWPLGLRATCVGKKALPIPKRGWGAGMLLCRGPLRTLHVSDCCGAKSRAPAFQGLHHPTKGSRKNFLSDGDQLRLYFV